MMKTTEEQNWEELADYIDDVIEIKHADSKEKDNIELLSELSANVSDYVQALEYWREDSKRLHHVTYYRPLKSHRRLLGKPLTLMRRVIRRLLRFLLEPIVDEQRAFNASVAATIAQLEGTASAFRNYTNEMMSEVNHTKDGVNGLWEHVNKIYAEIDNMHTAELPKIHAEIHNMYTTELPKIQGIIHEMYLQQDKSEMQAVRAIRSFKETDFLRNQSCDKSATTQTGDSKYSAIDYFNFENNFRGARYNVKKTLMAYLPYFEGKENVIDLGCGRGEFLELLKNNNINCTGVDLYDEFVIYCKMKGLDVVCDDVNNYLQKIDDESADGIFSAHLVEHLEFEYLVAMYRRAYEVLKPGGCLIIETPNPTCLGIYYSWFYVDPSHVKPVHPKTQEYFLKEAGFSNIEILFTETSKLDYKLPLLEGEGIDNLRQFNEGIEHLSDLLFGSMDYAIIATK